MSCSEDLQVDDDEEQGGDGVDDVEDYQDDDVCLDVDEDCHDDC